jgi:valyl-tRNA synthetase
LGDDVNRKRATQWVLVSVLEASLKLIHPFMPFLTEEIWSLLKEKVQSDMFSSNSIMIAAWPEPSYQGRFEKEAGSVRLFQDAVAGIRDLRSRLGLKPADLLPEVCVVSRNEALSSSLGEFHSQILHLARVQKITAASKLTKTKGVIGKVYSEMEIFVLGLPHEELEREENRTRQKIEDLEALVRSIESRLSDERFVSKAPEEVVEKERQRKADFEKQIAAYRENLLLFQ